MNDDELEQRLRDSLQTRARDVAVDGAPRLVTQAVATSPRRRRTALWAAVGAAAAVTVVAVGVQAVHLPSRQEQGVDDPGRARSSSSTTGSTASSTAGTQGDASGWREESWHGLQVSVPADWGWGTAPVDGYLCGGPGALVLADGTERVNPAPDTPYVGRPIMISDACQGGDVITGTPAAPYVWLGADVAPGTVDLGGGYVQETVETHGSTLTVATDDASVRRRILASATASGCPDDVVGQLPGAYEVGGPGGEVEGGGLCVFQRSQAGTLELVYSGELSTEQAQAYYQAAQQATQPQSLADALGDLGSCPTDELAVVRLKVVKGSAVWVRNTVVDLDCGWVTTHRGVYRTLDDATRRLIVDLGGLRAVLTSEVGSVG